MMLKIDDAPPTAAGLSDSAPQPTAPVAVSTEVDEAEWDAFLQRAPGATVDHLWRWREIFTGVFGHSCVYLAARRDRRLVGVLPLVRFQSRLFGRSVISLPMLNYGGIVAADGAVAAALVERAVGVARQDGASHVELRHRARQLADLPARQHKVAMLLPLPASRDALWGQVDRKIRNQVRKAEKEGLTREEGGAALVDDFYGVFARNMRDLGTPVYSKRLFSETLRLFPDRARVHVVRHGGAAVAAAVTVRFRDTVLVPWASSLREFRHLCPNMLLYWQMLEKATLDGAATFDFGRSSRGAGTHQFKLQWGAHEVPLHSEYVLLGKSELPDQGPTNPRFSLAIEAWKRLPLWAAARLGPAIVRHIP